LAKVKVCCDDMKDSGKRFDQVDSGAIDITIDCGCDFSWMFDVKFCPWCGKKLETE